jgi:hypothetical protein
MTRSTTPEAGAPPASDRPLAIVLDREPTMHLSFYPVDDGALIIRTTRTKHGAVSCAVDPLRLAEAFSSQPPATGLLPPGTLGMGNLAGHPFVALRIPPRPPEPMVVARSMGSYETATYRLPLPPLVFAGWKDIYAVFALATTAWPAATTPLCRAPLLNVYGDSTICWGSGERPPAAHPSTMAHGWETYLTGSHFSQHEYAGRSRRHPEHLVEQYRALDAAGAATYPLDDLVPSDWTLDALLSGAFWRER